MNRFQRQLLIVASCCLSLFLPSPAGTANAQKYEVPATLNAADVLPKELLKGPHHTVGKTVKNDGYMNIYQLKTDHGDLEVRGTYFLIKRISETAAIDYLIKNYPSGKVAGDAAADTAMGMLKAPIKGAEKLADTVSDSEKLKKTARAIPGGVANLFGTAANTVGSVAAYTYDTGKSVVKGDTKDTGRKLGEGAKSIERHALDFVGYNRTYRELAQKLQVDPYTENQILRDELRRVSSITTTVKVGAKFVPSVYSIPGVGTANKYLGYAEKAATYEDPVEVDKLNKTILGSLGKGGGDSKGVTALMSNDAYSPPMRRDIADALQSLRSVSHIEALIAAASEAKSREIAQFYVQAIGKLAELHKSGTQFSEVIPDVMLPAAVTPGDLLVVPLPIDHLFWTPEVAKIFKHFEQGVLKDGRAKSGRVLFGGTASPRSKQELTAVGAREILEKVVF